MGVLAPGGNDHLGRFLPDPNNTLDLIDRVLKIHNLDPSTYLFQTDDDCGDIVATSDGKKITISRQGLS